MLDASIPLKAQECEQWGNPRNPEHYSYMKSYSPYDNVAAKEYRGRQATGDEAGVESDLPEDQLRGGTSGRPDGTTG
jgi:prolyl oligopeptidase family protein